MKRIATRGHGFTLIEMLIVIAIIGILAGLLLTAIAAAMKKARETRASSEVRQIALAWESYLREYSTWPSGTDAAGQPFGGTEGSLFVLVENATNLLGGADVPAGANPKKIVFFQRKDSALRDPWKQSYRYMLDLDYSGSIPRPPAQGGDVISRSVIVWSTGVDKSDTSAAARNDDRCSWK